MEHKEYKSINKSVRKERMRHLQLRSVYRFDGWKADFVLLYSGSPRGWS